ncbi:MAG: PAS domain S-box protein [Nitrospirota bacterium]
MSRSISREILERKQIERALRESEEKYRNLINNIPLGVFKATADGDILYINEALARLLEYESPEELLTEDITSRYKNPQDREAFIKHLRENNHVKDMEFEFLSKTGKTKNVLLGATIHNTIITATVMDISERKRSEEALRKSEERYRSMVNAVTSYTYSVDVREGRAISTYHSIGCFPITGYYPDDYEAEPYLWHSMIYPDDRIKVEESIKKVLSGHKVDPLEHRIIHRDGRVVWVRNTIVPHCNEEGQLVQYDGLIEDITERKKLETQLIQAQKMEAVGTLAGGIAHDFNNILTAIISYLNILLMKMGEDDPLRTYVNKTIDSSEKATALIHSLLAFSRKQVINPKPMNVNNIIQKVKNLLMRLIGEDIELKTYLADRDLVVMADADQLEQVLMNLATNARDAMPDGGTMTIGTDIKEIGDEFIKVHGYGEAGEYAAMTVSDTGIGMDEETRKRIFDPFFTTKDVGKGTGLGLAMVYGIIKQHNGYITCYSEPRKGSTFNIYLPLIRAKVEKTRSKAVSALGTGTETILLVEDDAEVRMAAKEILTESGYKVIEAVDGEEAIQKFNKKGNREEIQLLILDVVMPKKNGKEVYEAIKKIRSDVKVVFISGYPAEIIHKKGVMENGLDFVMKPFSPHDLLKKVRGVLDKKDMNFS